MIDLLAAAPFSSSSFPSSSATRRCLPGDGGGWVSRLGDRAAAGVRRITAPKSSGSGGGGEREGMRRSKVNQELWYACAGPLVALPSAGSLVVCFRRDTGILSCPFLVA